MWGPQIILPMGTGGYCGMNLMGREVQHSYVGNNRRVLLEMLTRLHGHL